MRYRKVVGYILLFFLNNKWIITIHRNIQLSFIILLCCFFDSELIAQPISPENTFVSPNAASLGTVSDISASLYTGSTNVNIPIHELNELGITVPINLQNDETGIRPDVYPGWVGMGWTLNAGGVITRIVNGFPDDLRIKTYSPDFADYKRGYLFNSDPIANDNNWGKKVDQFISFASQYDKEPDEYIMNINGKSYRFYLTEGVELISKGLGRYITNNISVIGEPGVHITMELRFTNCIDDGCSSTQGYTLEYSTGRFNYNFYSEMFITGFEVVLPDGTTYNFGGYGDGYKDPLNISSVEKSANFFSENWLSLTNDSWFLTKIVNPQRREINFEYSQGNTPILGFSRSVGLEKVSTNTSYTQWFSSLGLIYLYGYNNSNSDNAYAGFTGRVIYPCYLSKIVSENQEIDFNISASVQKPYNYSSICDYWDKLIRYQVLNYLDLSYSNPDIDIPYPLDNGPHQFFYVGTSSNSMNNYYDFSKAKWYQLDEIVIKDKLSNTFKEFEFKYSNNIDERLRLLSLQEKGGNSLNPAYKFEYENYTNIYGDNIQSHQQNGNTNQLPGYCIDAIDHWGYYNGADNPSSTKYNFIPDLLNGSNLDADYFSYRNPDYNYAYTGALNKIKYPTGGSTKFYYGPNKYIKKISRKTDGGFQVDNVSETEGGGIRIEKTEYLNSDASTEKTVTYSYSNGILGGIPKYHWVNYTENKYSFDVNALAFVINTDAGTQSEDFFNSTSIIPFTFNKYGNSVGYSKVTETASGNGKSEYYYSNYENYFNTTEKEGLDEGYEYTIDIGEKSLYTPYNSLKDKRGLLKEKWIYNENGIIIHKDKFVYQPNEYLNGNFIKEYKLSRYLSVDGKYSIISGTAYKIYTYPYFIQRKEITDFDLNGSNGVTKVQEFSNNYYNLLSESSTTLSDGSTFVSTFKYPIDYYWGSSQIYIAESSIFKTMVDRNIINIPIEETTLKNNLVIGSELSLFDLKNDIIVPKEHYILKLSSPSIYPLWGLSYTIIDIPSNQISFHKSTDYILFEQYQDYDSKGNILQTTDRDGILTSYLWDATGNYPMAQVKGALYSQISPQNGQAANYSSLTLRNSLNSLVPSAYIQTYSYKPLIGMASQTDPNGKSTYYEYDSFGRLQFTKDDQSKILKKFDYHYSGQN